jgi:hypothetical protein
MTLRESLGEDVERIHAQVDALLDKEDGVLVFFDGGRAVIYAEGFGVSASQLELLSVDLERVLRAAVGRGPTHRANKRRNRERNQRTQHHDGVRGDGRDAVGRVLRMASKIA